jgi:subtilisin-like proprotein convertase family protein
MMRRAAALCFLLILAIASTAEAQAPVRSLTGQLDVVWSDGRPGPASGRGELFFLTTDEGETVEVLLDEATLRAAGGILRINRKRVTIAGSWSAEPSLAGAERTWRATSISPARGRSSAHEETSAISGPQPWVSILCKFSDIATEPENTTFFQNMYASTHPGMDHYWKEQSYNLANVTGSAVAGWFTLPHPRSHYVFDSNGDDVDEADLNNLAIDCIAAGDSTVNYASFVGINMMFNEVLDCCAWGGGRSMTLDSVSKTWRVTWDPPWAFQNVAVIGHEMGHGFGLPHSSGMYGLTYDNQWDVMSDTWTNCANAQHATYGCLGQHTISFHKEMLDWVTPANTFTLAQGTMSTITLEQLAQPATGNYRMAKIPIAGTSTRYYTVEVRRRVGYDVQLPGEGVIIHEIDETRGIPANVVDADGNGNTGDAGGIWLPGETFTAGADGIGVSVNSATATGYVVTLTSVPLPTVSVNDVSVTEGNAGNTNATFTATLSASSGSTVSVEYTTADGTAAGSTNFSNSSAISIPTSQNNATPYPSTISVAGLSGTISKVTVTLNALSHSYPADVDILLVGPGGQSVVLMSDAGNSTDASAVNLTFDDSAAAAVSQANLVTGTYKPGNVSDGEGLDNYPSPAPPSGYGSALSVFNGTSPNGTWSLYVVDDFNGDGGSIAGGWSLQIAGAGSDYIPTAGLVTFAPGTTTQTFSIPVVGDVAVESNETFFVNLSNASLATIADGQGQGTITNDDGGGAPPTNVVATATSATSVNVNWTTAPGAASYRVYRSAGSGVYTLVGSPTLPPLNDATASANTSYLYKVRSFSGAESADSNIDLATTTVFTDPTLTVNTTGIKLVHFTELLTAVNATRVLAGLSPIAFTAPAPATNVTIRRQHLLDLRSGLDAARALLTLTALTYTDPSITAGTTKVKAAHVTEVRNGTQ